MELIMSGGGRITLGSEFLSIVESEFPACRVGLLAADKFVDCESERLRAAELDDFLSSMMLFLAAELDGVKSGVVDIWFVGEEGCDDGVEAPDSSFVPMEVVLLTEGPGGGTG